MGLFDKLKVAVGGTPNVKSTEPKEDLSGASLMDLVEKIDTYLSEFRSTMNGNNYTKLETAMIELANRTPTIPLTKRAIFTQYNSYYKIYLDNLKKCIALGPKGKEIAQDLITSISTMCSSMAMLLSQ